MNWQDILHIHILDADGTFLRIDVGFIFFVLVIVGFIIFLYFKKSWKTFFNFWEAEEANIKLGGLGEIKIKPDYQDIQIAHKAWVELTTRKAGLEFDEEHDVIAEIYDSWYKLFSEMRDLVKQIPSDKIRKSEDTQQLVALLVDALNKGLRPHLTKWQARFRSWYKHAQESQPGKSPQEIQKKFPAYKELVKELKVVNKQMVDYTAFIKKIAHGDII